MRATAKTLKQFVSSFGLPAYGVQTIPKDITLPYLTYPITEPEWNQKTSFYIQGWYRTTEYSEMLEKADKIVEAIGVGITLKSDSGYVVIYPESPLIQTLVDGDTRSFYINLSLNSFQMPGAYPEPVETTETVENTETQTPSESPEEGE